MIAAHVSVIIPCYGNVQASLEQQLQSLRQQDYRWPWEIMVADNGIDFNTRAYLKTQQVVIVKATERPGRAYAINRAVARSTAPILLTLDSDDVVSPGYITAMAGALRRHPFVGARLDTTRINEPWVHARRQPLQVNNIDHYVGGLPCVVGAGMGFTRTAFDLIGGFDNNLLSLEDVDFSLRMHEAGIQPMHVGEATVHYRYRTTFKETFHQERAYGRGEVTVLAKHHRLQRRGIARSVHGWMQVLGALAGLRHTAGRLQVATRLGAAVGRLEGSISNRLASPISDRSTNDHLPTHDPGRPGR